MALPVSLAPKTVRPIPKRNLAVAAAGGGGGSGSASAPSIEQQAQGEIDPIIAALTGQATSQANAAAAAIQGLTNSYGQQLGAINYGAPYSNAEAQQAAVDAALQASLTGQGNTLSQQLASQLGSAVGASGQGAVQQVANQAASQGAGGGNAEMANGSAALSNLIADAAAANSYGSQIPGIVALAGLQGVQQAEGNAQNEIAQGALQAESQLPTIEQQLRSNKLQAQSLANTKAYQRAEIAAKDATLGLQRYKDVNSVNQGLARLGIEQQNANTAVSRLNLEAQKAASSNQQAWARIGIEDDRLKMEIAKQNLSAKSGGLSAEEISRYKSIADSWVTRTAGTTLNPTTGKVEPALTPEQATTQALKEGVPLSVIVPAMEKYAKANGVSEGRIKAYAKQYAPLMKSMNRVKLPPFAPASYGNFGANSGVILRQLSKYPKLDPNAVLAIASQEGLGGGIGDNGTSFGPFQMHIGGALPASVAAKGEKYAQAWAWSPQGIDYALQQINSVAGGLKGKQAIAAISRRFERSLNPSKEIAGAIAAYGG